MKPLTMEMQKQLIDNIEALGLRAVRRGIEAAQPCGYKEIAGPVAAAYVHEFMTTVREVVMQTILEAEREGG